MTLDVKYTELAYFLQPCSCRAHSQHRLRRWQFEHPKGTLVLAARDLGLSYANAKQLNHRLARRPDLSRLCPECFRPALSNDGCRNCGFEPTAARAPEIAFDMQSPTNWIHAGNQLGSVTNYRALHFGNHYAIIARRVEGCIEKPLVRACKSDVMNFLKYSYPEDGITDTAGRLIVKEVRELRARWPRLTSSKHARRQIVENVIATLKLTYPKLRNGDMVTSDMSEARQSEPEGQNVLPDGGMEE